ncbi:MAG: DUF4373 domain-containing protein, partial [Dehalococcoidales bacterium]|nr:DUF4373 domain-containing protein [Dehalococcoidales bacterium]
MDKSAYWVRHDSNASQDPKIVQMRAVYGYEGYGWYWRLVETLRDEKEHKLTLDGKYAYHGFAKLLETTPEKAGAFIEDCIGEFHLFSKNGDSFWSDSLIRRLKEFEEKREHYRSAGRKGATARWNQGKLPLTDEEWQQNGNANGNAIITDGNANGNAIITDDNANGNAIHYGKPEAKQEGGSITTSKHNQSEHLNEQNPLKNG